MIGKIIGNYQITSELAQGGMGAIYRGRHLHLPREVAVKSILLGSYSPSSQAQLKARFRREAYVQSQLDHPNIVRVYEFFAARDNYYLVMEYVPGMSLRDLLARQGAPAPAQAIYLLKQALAALDYAHNFNYLDESERHYTGVIHRDIKPANILLDTKGKLKITDFGIVKAMGEQRGMRMTQSGFHPGTVEYISPEQLLGREIDVRADIYSLGVTFYEIITGRLPFQRSATGSDWEIRKGHIELDPPPIQDLRPDVHPQLAEIMMRSLRKKAEERFQSAALFLEALQNYEQNYAEQAQTLRSPSVKLVQSAPVDTNMQEMNSTLMDESATLERQEQDEIASPVQKVKSRRKWPMAVGGLGLLLAGTAGGAIFFAQRRPPESALQPETTKVATPSPTLAPASSPVSSPASSTGDGDDSKPKPAARSAPAPVEQAPLIQAQNLESQERYDEAIKVYENFLVRNPRAPGARIATAYLSKARKVQDILVAADSAMNNQLYLAAKKQYLKALKLRPNSSRAKQGLANADLNMKKGSSTDQPLPPRTRRKNKR